MDKLGIGSLDDTFHTFSSEKKINIFRRLTTARSGEPLEAEAKIAEEFRCDVTILTGTIDKEYREEQSRSKADEADRADPRAK